MFWKKPKKEGSPKKTKHTKSAKDKRSSKKHSKHAETKPAAPPVNAQHNEECPSEGYTIVIRERPKPRKKQDLTPDAVIEIFKKGKDV